MTWDSREPRNQAKPIAPQSQGWEGPGWWDETSVPARKTASSVRSATATQSVRGTAPTLPTTGTTTGPTETGFGTNGSTATDRAGLLAARRARSRAASRPRSQRNLASVRLVVGFALGVFGALLLATVAVLGLSRGYDGKVMPGVHVGTVDLSGLTREEAISKLDLQFAALGQGNVTVTTPVGNGTITYQQAGRGPDSAAMADAALSVGHGDNLVASVATAIRTFTSGVDIPLIVKLDPLALETKLHDMTSSSQDPPKDANVVVTGTDYTVVAGAAGRGIDETAIAKGLIDQLASVDAPSDLQVGGAFITVQPNVTDQDAQAAVDSANKMSVDVTLTNAAKTWKITAATIRTWLMFGVRTDGTFGPVVNPALVKTYVATLSANVLVKPIEPNITYKAGKPTGVSGGQPGQELDVDGTSQAIEAYLDALGSGGATTGANVALVVNVTQPTIGQDLSLTGFSVIGSWNVTYFPGESNGGGANIEVPAQVLNGRVIQAGEHFSFLQQVGAIDAAHGFKMGGVIKNGVSNHTGAMGGGICSASTTFFNAAIQSGLQIDERHAHFYHIDRYPMGLDATVYSNGSTTWDMRFTNDTPNPIVIRSWTAGGSASRKIYVEFWSLPTGRKIAISNAVVSNISKAKDTTQYVASLQPGLKSYRKEYPTDGLDAYRTRTVTDASGSVIHYDQFWSHYSTVNGILQIKGTAKPAQTPTPTPGPGTPKPTAPPATAKPTAPPATPTPTPAPTPKATAILPLTLIPLLLVAALPVLRRRRFPRK